MTHSVCSQMGDYDAALVVTFESYDDGGWCCGDEGARTLVRCIHAAVLAIVAREVYHWWYGTMQAARVWIVSAK
jgi:hypothetical protein